MLTTLGAGLAVPLLFLLWSRGGRLQRSPWPAVVAIGWFGVHLVRDAVANVREPREWDFGCFWLYGHIAVAHQNLYDPAAFTRFKLPFIPGDEFRAAVLNVGFPYPPPTIVLFYPLGYIDSVPLGLALWYIVQFAALAAAAWILARAFMPAGGWRSAVFILAIIVALPASALNVDNAQTHFLLLLLIALAALRHGTPAGAVWTTLALWVKPYAAVLLLLAVVRGRWRLVLAAAGTVVLSLLGAALFVGPAALLSYLRSNPSAREPSFAFVEAINQSLLAVVLRFHAALPAHVSALHEPLYVAGALLLGGLTVALCARPRADSEIAFASLLLLGLIVYPGALSSYGVVLIVPLLVLWRHRRTFPGGAATVAGIFAIAVMLQSVALQRGFEANVLVWIACMYLLVASPAEAPAEPLTPARAATPGSPVAVG